MFCFLSSCLRATALGLLPKLLWYQPGLRFGSAYQAFPVFQAAMLSLSGLKLTKKQSKKKMSREGGKKGSKKISLDDPI